MKICCYNQDEWCVKDGFQVVFVGSYEDCYEYIYGRKP